MKPTYLKHCSSMFQYHRDWCRSFDCREHGFVVTTCHYHCLHSGIDILTCSGQFSSVTLRPKIFPSAARHIEASRSTEWNRTFMDVTCVPLSFLVSPYAKISFRLSISPQLHPLTLTLGNSGKGGEHVRGVGISSHSLLSHLHLQDLSPLSIHWAPVYMSDNDTDTEPYLFVEKCGSTRGNPIYVITKYIPSVGVLEWNNRAQGLIEMFQRYEWLFE